MIYLAYPYEDPVVEEVDGVRFVGHGLENLPSVPASDAEIASPAQLVRELKMLLSPEDTVVPIAEEAVLPVCDAASKAQCTSMSFGAAISCSDRVIQRACLDKVHLSPHYHVLDPSMRTGIPFPFVLRARASMQSDGVAVVSNLSEYHGAIEKVLSGGKPHLDRISAVTGHGIDPTLIIEEFCPGPIYEISVLLSDVFEWSWHPLYEHWDRPAGKIVGYEKVRDITTIRDLREIANLATRSLGLTWCVASVEIAGPPWRVIEVNARPGWDHPEKRYFEMMDGAMHPYERMAKLFAEVGAKC